MPGLPKLSLVEGGFDELASELANYLDSLKGEGSNLASTVTPLLADPENAEAKPTDKDAVLKTLVSASSALNSAPERELQAAYNLLIHLISQSEDPDQFLARVCTYLKPQQGQAIPAGLALGILGTIFNTIQPDDEVRYHILLAITEVVKQARSYESIKSQLKGLDEWVHEWELEPDDARTLYLSIADAASAANEVEDSYLYLLKALRTLQTKSTLSTPEARELSLRALRTALQNEKHFDFEDLTALDSIQSLRQSESTWYELLELFSSENYDDLQDFKEANSSFLSENELDEEILDRKMRLLTLASLAAQASHTRTLSYSAIAKALNIPSEDVEVWVIDSIRSGLVEGKLSQQKQEFLIHRSTYRVFGENQWREVASRLETWRSSLVNVLGVIRAQKEEFIREREAELSGPPPNQGYRGDRGDRGDRRPQRNAPPPAVEVE